MEFHVITSFMSSHFKTYGYNKCCVLLLLIWNVHQIRQCCFEISYTFSIFLFKFMKNFNIWIFNWFLLNLTIGYVKGRKWWFLQVPIMWVLGEFIKGPWLNFSKYTNCLLILVGAFSHVQEFNLKILS